jgi:hypothetical protein
MCDLLVANLSRSFSSAAVPQSLFSFLRPYGRRGLWSFSRRTQGLRHLLHLRGCVGITDQGLAFLSSLMHDLEGTGHFAHKRHGHGSQTHLHTFQREAPLPLQLQRRHGHRPCLSLLHLTICGILTSAGARKSPTKALQALPN